MNNFIEAKLNILMIELSSPPPPPKAETLEASAKNTTLSESSNATDAREALISSLDVQREVNLAIQRAQDLIQQDQVAFSDLTY